MRYPGTFRSIDPWIPLRFIQATALISCKPNFTFVVGEHRFDMQQPSTHFMQPSLFDRIVNRAFGFMVKLGFGLLHNFLLEVRGRKSGRVYSTPVNILEFKDKKYLVAPRGDTQWVRNVMVSKKATL